MKQEIWFFSGAGRRAEYIAGTAIVIHYSFFHYIDEMEPVTDRIIYTTSNAHYH